MALSSRVQVYEPCVFSMADHSVAGTLAMVPMVTVGQRLAYGNWVLNAGVMAKKWGVSCPLPVVPPLPAPVSDAVCGVQGALSEMLSEAVRAPAAAGVNLTLIVQLSPALRLELQAFDCAK